MATRPENPVACTIDGSPVLDNHARIMSWLEQYRSFSYHSRSDRIEERLSRRFLPRFGELAQREEPILAEQRDVTGRWREVMDSTVRAISWDVIPGVRMVLVLLDDEDFGPEMKWFFRADGRVDYKHLVMAAEGGTELLAAGSGAAPSRPVDLDVRELSDRVVHSSMFCFSFSVSSLDAGRLTPGASWNVTRGLRASVEDAPSGRTLRLGGTGDVGEYLLMTLRAQVELMSGS